MSTARENAEAALVAASVDISDARRCEALHITPATGTILRRLVAMSDALRALLAETAPTEWEYGVDDVGMHPHGPVWRQKGEKRPIDYETTMAVPGRLRRWYCVDTVYRRRKAGPWEQVDAAQGGGHEDARAEMGMPCMNTTPHAAHTWQMSATGYCDCPGIPAPPEDVRDALARALYDIDPLPLHRGEGDEDRIVGPKPWEWVGEGYREHLRSQADAILARFIVTPKINHSPTEGEPE